MRTGLIGKSLNHSYSKFIHNYAGNEDYELISLNEEELSIFFTNKDFTYVNVTIPYKETVIKYLDELSKEALDIKAVNLVINNHGILKGYNTDYLAFIKLLDYYKIDPKNKKALILGTGGAAKMVMYALTEKGAETTLVSRTPLEGYSISYEEASHRTYDILVNATPLGMYPDILSTPINITKENKCKYLIDLIYNPYRTLLIQNAQELGITTINGKQMLINQALYSLEIYNNTNSNNNSYNYCYNYCYNDLYKDISEIINKKRLIVLIGMPGSGKTTTGKLLAKYLKDKYHMNSINLDTDEIIENEYGSIEKIIRTNKEESFREIETRVIRKLSLQDNLIISTGGGVILNKENMLLLKARGIIVLCNPSLQTICKRIEKSPRALIKTKEDVFRTYNERCKLYHKYADIFITSENITEIDLEKIYTYLCMKE